MKITRQTEPVKEHLTIDLEIDFPDRTSALDFIFGHDLLRVSEISSELYNADKPDVWIHFKIAGTYSILAIELH